MLLRKELESLELTYPNEVPTVETVEAATKKVFSFDLFFFAFSTRILIVEWFEIIFVNSERNLRRHPVKMWPFVAMKIKKSYLCVQESLKKSPTRWTALSVIHHHFQSQLFPQLQLAALAYSYETRLKRHLADWAELAPAQSMCSKCKSYLVSKCNIIRIFSWMCKWQV